MEITHREDLGFPNKFWKSLGASLLSWVFSSAEIVRRCNIPLNGEPEEF